MWFADVSLKDQKVCTWTVAWHTSIKLYFYKSPWRYLLFGCMFSNWRTSMLINNVWGQLRDTFVSVFISQSFAFSTVIHVSGTEKSQRRVTLLVMYCQFNHYGTLLLFWCSLYENIDFDLNNLNNLIIWFIIDKSIKYIKCGLAATDGHFCCCFYCFYFVVAPASAIAISLLLLL